MSRLIVWFSCGAASAVAAKLAIERFGLVHVVYCDMSADEHADNVRFKADVEQWIGQPIETIRSVEYASIEDVFERTRYMSGIGGARCTVEMKKVPRFAYQHVDDIHVFGYTLEEESRIKAFEAANPELQVAWVLRDAFIRKPDCFRLLQDAGIAIPAMYALGFSHNNCIGCCKATSPAYWQRVRMNFPDVFLRRAAQSRDIGCKLVRLNGKRIYLDELPVDDFAEDSEDISCGPHCQPTLY